jgi:pimeloyl-ACP methyl ester carboxylesterase
MRRAFFPLLACWVLLAFAGVVEARPPNGAYESFRVKTDNVPQAEIAGWLLQASGRPNGTMFLLHGWNNSKERVVGWEWVRDRLDWNVVMFDFREHGESTRTAHLSSLGYHEIWDVKAVVDYAERKGLVKPYVIYGRSLGGAAGLRWASMDPRISGVFAVSPFKNAYLASKQLPAARLHVPVLPSPFTLHPGYRRMLQEVDIPKAVAARDDLRIWIIVGEHDSFPEADQHEILSASRSPERLKRLVVAEGCDHHNVWTWKGTGGRPGHDHYLTDFLAASGGGGTTADTKVGVGVLAGAAGIGVAGILIFLGHARWSSKNSADGAAEGPQLPPPTSA